MVLLIGKIDLGTMVMCVMSGFGIIIHDCFGFAKIDLFLLMNIVLICYIIVIDCFTLCIHLFFQKQSCTFVVWDQPWLNGIQLTEIDCGSIETVEERSSGAEDAAVFAASHLQTYGNGMYRMHFRRILKAEQEVSYC